MQCLEISFQGVAGQISGTPTYNGGQPVHGNLGKHSHHAVK